MLQFLQTFISFLALCVICVFVARHTRLKSSLVPLPIICATMVLCVLFGYINLLYQAVLFLHILALAMALYMLITIKKGGFYKVLTPGFLLFIIIGVVFLVLLAIQQPIAISWDEFSMWAYSSKVTKSFGEIYSGIQTGMPFPMTQKPGLPTLSYFFNFIGEFAVWRTYFAYNLLILSVISACIGALDMKHWKIYIPTSIVVFLLNYFYVYTKFLHYNPTYYSSLSDYPMAYVAGGLVAWHFNAVAIYKSSMSLKRFCVICAMPLFFIAGAVTLCKDTGLALALLGIMIVFFDLLFSGAFKGQKKLTIVEYVKAVLLPKVSLAAFAAFSVVLCFVTSSLYIVSLGISVGSVGGASQMSYFTMMSEGIKQLIGLPPSPVGEEFVHIFEQIKTEMIVSFFPHQITGSYNGLINMFGSGFAVVALVLFVCVLIFIFSKNRQIAKSSIIFLGFSSIGFLAYYAFIGFTYVYVFKNGIVDYPRYINTYYIMWLCALFALFAVAAMQKSRCKNFITLANIGLSAIILFRFTSLIDLRLTFIDYPSSAYSQVVQFENRAQAVKNTIDKGDRLFFVSSFDDGFKWFVYHYNLLPENVLVYSMGGGMFADPLRFETLSAKDYISTGQMVLSLEEFAAYLAMYECDYVFIDEADVAFYESYDEIMSDGAKSAIGADMALYKVNIIGTPEYEEITASDVTYDSELNEDGTVAINKNYDTRYKMTNALDCVSLTPVNVEVQTHD